MLDNFGRVDILVNDAAYNIWIPFDDLDALTLEEWSKIISINLTGPMLCIKAVAGPMKRQGVGRIVNISSVAGLTPTGSSIPYGVSKAGLIQLTRGMAVGLAPEILVNCIAPGYLEGTRMSNNLEPSYRESARQGSLLKRAAHKDDVADQVVAFCRTDSITGQTLVIDSGRIFRALSRTVLSIRPKQHRTSSSPGASHYRNPQDRRTRKPHKRIQRGE